MRTVSRMKVWVTAVTAALLCSSCIVHRDHPRPPKPHHHKKHKHKKPPRHRPPHHPHAYTGAAGHDGTYYAAAWYGQADGGTAA